MTFKTVDTKIQCPCCSLSFSTEYYHGGSIEHENTLSNMGVFVSRWDGNWDKEDLFLRAINLSGNFCEIKQHNIEVGMQIFKCVNFWLERNNRLDIVNFLKCKEGEIKEKYNSVRYKVIAEIEKELKNEKGKLVT